jgi:pSer/pThr/pTyr-binding forkhead associated (FHA) protein
VRPLEIVAPGGISTLPLDRPVTVGRTKANVLVEHQDIATTHCRLEPFEDGWKVTDLGDKGVFTGGTRVAEVVLRPGEVADLGGFPGAVALAMPRPLSEPVELRLRTPGMADNALVLLKLPMMLGRASWADLPLADRNVSQLHARLRSEHGRVVVDDLQSRNGTWVNGERVKSSRALQPGDRIQVGETEIRFGVAAAGAEPAPGPPVPAPTPPSGLTPVRGPNATSMPSRAPQPPAAAPSASPSVEVSQSLMLGLPSTHPPADELDPDITPRVGPARDIVIPQGLSVEQLSQEPDQHVHLPAVRHQATQSLWIDTGNCPACGEEFYLSRPGVLTGAMRLAAGLVGGRAAKGRVGRCSNCGARLSTCPECEVANSAPSLFERINCRGCGEEFLPG